MCSGLQLSMSVVPKGVGHKPPLLKALLSAPLRDGKRRKAATRTLGSHCCCSQRGFFNTPHSDSLQGLWGAPHRAPQALEWVGNWITTHFQIVIGKSETDSLTKLGKNSTKQREMQPRHNGSRERDQVTKFCFPSKGRYRVLHQKNKSISGWTQEFGVSLWMQHKFPEFDWASVSPSRSPKGLIASQSEEFLGEKAMAGCLFHPRSGH